MAIELSDRDLDTRALRSLLSILRKRIGKTMYESKQKKPDAPQPDALAQAVAAIPKEQSDGED